jgi:hypothetical protein
VRFSLLSPCSFCDIMIDGCTQRSSHLLASELIRPGSKLTGRLMSDWQTICHAYLTGRTRQWASRPFSSSQLIGRPHFRGSEGGVTQVVDEDLPGAVTLPSQQTVSTPDRHRSTKGHQRFERKTARYGISAKAGMALSHSAIRSTSHTSTVTPPAQENTMQKPN